jgi:hypothetical protein
MLSGRIGAIHFGDRGDSPTTDIAGDEVAGVH